MGGATIGALCRTRGHTASHCHRELLQQAAITHWGAGRASTAATPTSGGKRFAPLCASSSTSFGSAGRWQLRMLACSGRGAHAHRSRGVGAGSRASLSSDSPALFPQTGAEPHKRHPIEEGLRKLRGSAAPPLSDIVWSAFGAFAAMASFAFFDHLLAARGLTSFMASFGAVSVLLFAAPHSPVSQKWNVFMGHIGCAFIGVLTLAALGPGWVARAVALAAAVAYMQFTNSIHPPAAGLPLLFIDAPKFQHLRWWYVLFPGVFGCAYLFLLAQIVQLLKENVKF